MTLTNSLVTTIRNKQAEYFATKGKYFQGLRMPSTGVLDGNVNATINPALRPEDQEASWLDFDPLTFKTNTKIPYHIHIDVYQSPIGWGWVMVAEFWKTGLGPDTYGNDGDHWLYRHNEGPNQDSGIWSDWHIQPDEI